MFKELKNKIAQFGREGLFHIFGSSVLAKVGGLISSVVVVRNLPKASYGEFVDADNLYTYLAIFIGLGLTNAVIQYCSERVSDARRAAIYRYSVKVGMVGNVLLCLLVLALAAAKYYAGDEAVACYLATMCGLPFVAYARQYQQIVLRVKLKNKEYSATNTVYTIVHVGGNILFTLLWGVPGLIISQYLGHMLGAAYSTIALRREGFFQQLSNPSQRLERGERKEFLSYGLTCALTDFAYTVLVLLDVTCLGLVLQDPEILADYKVAATIPSACAFIPGSLSVYFYPKLVAAFSEGKRQGKELLLQVAKLYALVNSFACLCLVILAPVILWVVFGEQYAGTTPIFRLLSLNYLLFAARQLTGNAIIVMKKVKVNLLFAVISGVLNIALNLLMIPVMGSLGAAIATLLVTAFIVVLNVVYLRRQLRDV